MQELLTGKRRLPGFSGKWEVEALGEIALVTKGTQLANSEASDGDGFPHLNGGITPSGYARRANTLGGTIAISEGGNSCGYVQSMKEDYWCGGHCYSVVPQGLDNRFFYHALKAQQQLIMALRVGSGLPNVQKAALLAFRLEFPTDAPEQTAIGEILSDMDAEIVALETKLAKTRSISKGMMQELLTGRIRLV
jgi:type I restriction enzyme, S subunit